MKIFSTFIFLLIMSFALAQPKVNYIKMGNDEFKKGNYDKAIENFTMGIEQKSFLLENLYYGRAYAYFKKGDYENAKADLNKAIEHNKSYSNAYWLLGRVYSQTEKKRKALKLYNKAVKEEANSYLYSNRGLMKIEMNKLNSALKDFEIAIMLDANNPYAYNNRALAYIKQKKYNLASQDIEKALLLKASNPFIYKHKALLSIATNDLENACISLDKAIEMGYREYDNEVDELIKKYCPKDGE